MGLIKLSVIWFCRRIFIVYKGSAMDWATFILAIINICWTIAFALTLIFGCRLKPWLHWAPLQTDMIAHYCGDLRKPLLAAVISDFILEFTILMLPLPSVSMHTYPPGSTLIYLRYGCCKFLEQNESALPEFSSSD